MFTYEIISYKDTSGAAPVPESVLISAADIAKTSAEIAAGLPGWWPAGVMIHSPGYATIKEKGLDGSWTAL